MVLLVRTRSNSTALAACMRRVLHAIDRMLPVTEVAGSTTVSPNC
jgi:hypothetical protein